MKKTRFNLALAITLISFSLIQSCKKEDITPIITPATTVTLKSNITVAQTLKDLGSGVDYIIDGNLDVKGVTLTVDPDVVIQFTQNSSLRMLDFGALKANGTAAKPILFTGTQKSKGFWKGLIFESTNNTDNQLEFCTVEYAGEASAYSTTIKGAVLAGSFFSKPVLLSMKNVTLQNNSNNALYIDDQATLSALDNCVFKGNDTPIKAMEEGVNSIDNDNTFTGNSNDFIEWAVYGGGNIALSTTVRNLAIPYRFTSDELNIAKGATLTVAAGTKFKMGQNSKFIAYLGGVILMEGTATQPITFDGVQKTRGFWKGIISDGAGSSVTMKYVNVNDGGDLLSGTNAMVSQYATGSALYVSNCKMGNFTKYGLSYIDKTLHNTDIETTNTCDGGGQGCILKR
jgi:hypothetical protein